jgi:sulfide:quinone oxidoreductase
MAKVVILGGGVAGHTAALFARKYLKKKHQVVVVTPNSRWNWIPSNIWVGVGTMKDKNVTFELAPVYKRQGIVYIQAKAVSIHPEGGNGKSEAFVTVEHTSPEKKGEKEEVRYDYLINATGPRLNFDATPGLGPDKHSLSVCTPSHAAHSNEKFQETMEKLKQGVHQRFLIGVGHGLGTCQGAAFEYLFNIEYELRKRGLREKATLTYITNESNLGDFGIGGMHIRMGGYITHSKIFTESLFTERGIHWITGAHVNSVEPDHVTFELLDGSYNSVEYDFAMLIPPFAGVKMKGYDKNGKDITDKIFLPTGFMKVDADYTEKPFDEWKASDWPRTYQNPDWKNIFAAGTAFAPPHPISRPLKSSNGTPISPMSPRTGMPAAMIGKAVALSISDMIKGKKVPTHTASMTEIGAACVASAGASLTGGAAASMTMYPVVPDFERFPEYGRDLAYSFGELGLAGHWIKIFLHHLFIYKAKAYPGWSFIPE